MSFMNVTKYPPSLSFLLATLGPAVLSLAFLERATGPVGRFFVSIGRVPMFFYIAHIYLIHLLAVIAAMLQGFPPQSLFHPMWEFPNGYGFGLGVVYVVWIGVVLILFPACVWYAGVKRRRKDSWLRYL
jgi:hypothetical protein